MRSLGVLRRARPLLRPGPGPSAPGPAPGGDVLEQVPQGCEVQGCHEVSPHSFPPASARLHLGA